MKAKPFAFRRSLITLIVVLSILVVSGPFPVKAAAPVADPQPVTATEDTSKDIILTGSDADGDPLTFAIVANPAHGSLSGTAPNVTYTPAIDYNGPDSFTFKVFETATPASESSPATVSITVDAVNDAPSFTKGTDQTVVEDSGLVTVSGWATALSTGPADETGQALTFVVTNNNNGLFSVQPAIASNGTLTYTPAANANGSATVTAQLQDDGGVANGGINTSAAQPFTINVTAVNDAPVANAGSPSATEDTPVAVSLSGQDLDDNDLAFSIVGTPTKGALGTIGTPDCTSANTCTAAVTYTPAANQTGGDSFTFKVNDGTADSNTATVSIAISPAQDPPVADAQSITFNEDSGPNTITLTGSDPDDDTLSFAIVANPTKGTLGAIGIPNCAALNTCSATVTYTPNPNANGADSFTFTVSDGTATSPASTVSINLTAQNDTPVANAGSTSTNEDTPVTITLSGSDVDDNSLSFAITTSPAKGTLGTIGAPDCTPVNSCSTAVTYTPNPNANGSDSFAFTVSDGTAVSIEAIVSITVTAVNDAPIANIGSPTTNEDTQVTISLTATDVEDAPLTFTLTNPMNGTLNTLAPVADCTALNTCSASVTYTPNINYNGSDSFTFKVNDGANDSNTATLSITVNPVNDTPIADQQSVPSNEDTPITITLSGSDIEDNNLTFSIASNPTKGALGALGIPTCSTSTTTCSATVTYTPGINFYGSDSFTFIVNDGSANSLPATVTITVGSANDAPVATTQAVTVIEDTPKQIILSGTDVENDNLTFSIATNPTKGTLGLLGTPICSANDTSCTTTLTYTPNKDANGADSFTFIVNDGTVNSSPGTVTISITPVNDLPVAVPDTYEVLQGKTLTVTLETQVFPVTKNDSDVDQDALKAKINNPPAHLAAGFAFTLNENGTFIYRPAPDFVGSDTFTYHVEDAEGKSSNVVTVTIEVLDATGPVVNWVSPVVNPDNEIYYVEKTTLLLSAEATDNVAVKKVRFFRWKPDPNIKPLNGYFVEIAEDFTAPYETILDTTALDLDYNQVFVEAYDNLNNKSLRERILLYRSRQLLFDDVIYMPMVFGSK